MIACWAHGDVFVPAAYRWTFLVSGNTVDLCEECCAAFRATAAAEPDLGPARITELPD